MAYNTFKFSPIKLNAEEYKSLCQQIMTRDGGKCRCCHRRDGLQIHHIIKRSKVRLDVDWNLITLCFTCHEQVELSKLNIEQHHIINANEDVIFL
jgi:5-methylcytosine-specific restriction endonuclease McrA